MSSFQNFYSQNQIAENSSDFNEYYEQNFDSKNRYNQSDLNPYSIDANFKSTASSEIEYIQDFRFQNTESANYGQFNEEKFFSDNNQSNISEQQYQQSRLSLQTESIEGMYGESNSQDMQQQEQKQYPTNQHDQYQHSQFNEVDCRYQQSNIQNINQQNQFVFDTEQTSNQRSNQENYQIERQNTFQQTQIIPIQSTTRQNAKKKNKEAYSPKFTCILCLKSYAHHSGITNHAKNKHIGYQTFEIQMSPNRTLGRPPKNQNNQAQQNS
ncbi:hypothetical protein ABPG72_004973 [Tetrahymena utriculariae]